MAPLLPGRVASEANTASLFLDYERSGTPSSFFLLRSAGFDEGSTLPPPPPPSLFFFSCRKKRIDFFWAHASSLSSLIDGERRFKLPPFFFSFRSGNWRGRGVRGLAPFFLSSVLHESMDKYVWAFFFFFPPVKLYPPIPHRELRKRGIVLPPPLSLRSQRRKAVERFTVPLFFYS